MRIYTFHTIFLLIKDVIRNRWDIYKDEPIQQAAGLCYVLRRVVNTDERRAMTVLEILEKSPRVIIFYNFDYELDILMNIAYGGRRRGSSMERT